MCVCVSCFFNTVRPAVPVLGPALLWLSMVQAHDWCPLVFIAILNIWDPVQNAHV